MLSAKKIGLGFIALVLVSVIYYFTAGETKLTNEMKVRVNTELTRIQQSGFAVEERKVQEKEEHFVLSFDEPAKIVSFFEQQGSEITLEDAQALAGMKIGVDLKYLNNSYSALSVDMYPLNLPPSITQAPDLDEADKIFIEQLNDMLARKALLVHVDFNKLLSSFKGSVKDIHEAFKVETEVKIDMVGTTFNGEIKENRIVSLMQTLKRIHVTSGDQLEVDLEEMKSQYKMNGPSLYDSRSTYSIANIKITGKQEQNIFSVSVKNISGENDTTVDNGLASNKMKSKVGTIEMKENGELTKLSDTHFAFNIGNLDMDVLKALENVDTGNEAETNRLMQLLISKGISMAIPEFEVKKIYYKGKEMDGFSLSSTFQINKSTDLAMIQANPFAAMNAINTKTKIVLSDALFTLIAQQPKAMMLAMLIQPKVVNGKKIYELELLNGKITVNGKPLM